MRLRFSKFKKINKNSKVQHSLVHPLVSARQKLEFLRKFSPVYTVPELATPQNASLAGNDTMLDNEAR